MLKHKITDIELAWLLCIVNFINALDAMMVNPLFPLISKSFLVPVSYVGYGSSIYLLSAIFTGFIMFFYIDRLNKRVLLLVNLFAITILSLVASCLDNFYYFIFVRFLSGIFGGVVFSVVMSIILNQTQLKDRAKIMAIVMTSFAFISLLGLPFITFVANFISWRAPFIFVAFVSLVMFIYSYFSVEDNAREDKNRGAFKLDYKVILAASSFAVSQFGSALLIPLLVPIFIYILDEPISSIPFIFLIGGVASYIATNITRFLVKRFSVDLVILLFSIIFVLNILVLIFCKHNAYIFMFIYMYCAFARTVAITTFASFFTKPEQFDKYSTLQTNILNLNNLIAFILPSLMLGGRDINIETISAILVVSMLTIAILPFYLLLLKKVSKL